MARSAAAHVFVADLERCVLSEDDAHHLFASLRLRPGEAVTVSDGKGRWRLCRVGGGRGADELERDGPITEVARPEPPLTVGFALTKAGRPDHVVQRLTELGVDRLVPLSTARSVVRWRPADAAPHLERLRRVARAAAMQSRLAYLPEISPLLDLHQVREHWTAEEVALAHPGGRPISLEQRVVLVGPEGGWEPAELETGLTRVDLGPTRLRADTAAIAVGVLLTALRAGAVNPVAAGQSVVQLRGGIEGGSGSPAPFLGDGGTV